jgi:hypothetical protein
VFAAFTLFGQAALGPAVTAQPGLLRFYNFLLGAQHPREEASPEARAMGSCPGTTLENTAVIYQGSVLPASEVPTHEPLGPSSLSDLYRQIREISGDAEGADQTGVPARRIRALVEEHLDRLLSLAEKLSAEETEALVKRYCKAIVEMLGPLDQRNSEFLPLVSGLERAWRESAIVALQKDAAASWYSAAIESRRAMLPLKINEFELTREAIGQLAAGVGLLESELATAKITAKPALKSKISQARAECDERSARLEEIFFEAVASLAPEGRSLEEVEDLGHSAHDAPIDLTQISAQSLRFLKDEVERLDAASVHHSAQESTADIDDVEATSPSLTADNFAHADEGEREPQQASAVEPRSISKAGSEETKSLQPQDGATLAAPSASTVAHSDSVQSELEDLPIEVEEAQSLPAEVPATPSVIEAVKHLDYTGSPADSARAFLLAAEQYSEVPASVAEAVALHWLAAGHLNVAAQVLKDATESSLVSTTVLDPALFRLAFYGMNVWPKDQVTLGHMQREFNLVNQRQIEEHLERKPAGKIVPYLLVAATFQTSLFAGNETAAPTLLKLARGQFDGPLGQLIDTTIEFTTRGGRVDWEALRNVNASEVGQAAERVRNEVNAWVDRNEQRSNLWHTLRLALKQCVDEPNIARTIAAIRKGEKGSVEDVRGFAQTYDSPMAARELLDRLAAEVRADYSHQEQIDTNAYRNFERRLNELLAIARSWLLEVAPADVRSHEVVSFLERWRTQLSSSVSLLQGGERQVDLEHRAGQALLGKVLGRLQKATGGDAHLLWKYDQTEATYLVPTELFALTGATGTPALRMEWFASQLTVADWLRNMTEVARTHNAYRLQLLLLSERLSAGESLDGELKEVRREIDGSLATVRQSIERLRILAAQALMSDLIDDSRHQSFVASADASMEELEDLPTFANSDVISDRVQALCATLEALLKAHADSLETSLNSVLTEIRTKLGADAVSAAWETRTRAALSDFSLMVVHELVSQLQNHSARGEPVRDVQLDENPDLQSFLSIEKELTEVLGTVENPREAGARVIEAAPGGLQYNVQQHDFKSAIEDLVEQKKGGVAKMRKSALDLQTYAGISRVLGFAGFSVFDESPSNGVLERCEFSTHGEFRRLKLEVSRPQMPKGFPLFESGNKESVRLNLVYVRGEWSLSGFRNSIDQDGAPTTAVLLVGTALDSAQRNAFAALCKERKCTVFLLDPVVLSYLATISERRLEAFFKVAAPWTYYMPYYAGDTRLPAPPEMRFGRDSDAVELAATRGPALVYGGRQLGKTTLLHSAVDEFQKQSRNHRAFFIRMDGGLEHADSRDGPDLKEQVCARILKRLVDGGVMTRSHPEQSAEQLAAEFSKPGKYSVLVCLDEIDPILNRDANNDFPLFRSLAGLVNDPHHRFKVVIAGLENVNRFRSLPNVPLEQLGRPLPVTIMLAVDARRLIQVPLAALGYRFESPTLIDRIMAFTNRHPGLLHIVCAELVQLLANRRGIDVGDIVIRDTDLEKIERDASVRNLCTDRFDMTLNLDKRYMLIVYGLIERHGRSIASFSVKQALDVAKSWAPEQFQGTSESGFEALLEELVGLGVLKNVQGGSRHYALRNQSILQLVGASGDIEHKLLTAAEDVQRNVPDSLTCHPTTSESLISPLSLADEKMLLGARSATGSSLYSVSMIMGSEALGLGVDAIRSSFDAINEFENGQPLGKYAIRILSNAEITGLARFSEYLETALKIWAGDGPAVVLVPIDKTQTISSLMDMFDMASEKAALASRLKHRLRVVFLLGPKATWLWLSNPAHTTTPSELGGIVQLQRWTRHACEGLLDQQGMTFTVDQANRLLEFTEGWYTPLMRFVETRKRNKQLASNLSDLRDFRKLVDIGHKEFSTFIGQTGITSFPWSIKLAKLLQEYGTLAGFRVDDVRMLIGDESVGPGLDTSMADSVVKWWLTLRLIDPIDKGSRIESPDSVQYRFTPAILRAIENASVETSA